MLATPFPPNWPRPTPDDKGDMIVMLQQMGAFLTGLLGTSGAAADAVATLGAQSAAPQYAGVIAGNPMPSAATLAVSAAQAEYIFVSGSVTINGFDTPSGAFITRTLVFIGTPILTNSANLILPTNANIQTAVGDVATFRYEGGGVWRCTNYRTYSGSPLAPYPYTGAEGQIFQIVGGKPTFAAPLPSLYVKSRAIGCCINATGCLMSDNTVRTWGAAAYGALCSQMADSALPKIVPLPQGEVPIALYNSYQTMYVVMQSGRVFTWGRNDYGQCGVGTTAQVLVPTKIPFPETIASLVISPQNVLDNPVIFALSKSGNVYSFGMNTYGQLGLGDTTNRTSPVKISTLSNIVSLASVGSGILSSMGAIDNTGRLFTWGLNNYGQLGLGDTTNRTTPIQVSEVTAKSAFFNIGNYFDGTNWNYGGSLHVITPDGKLYSCGYNNYGQLGLGDTTNRTGLVAVTAITDAVSKVVGSGMIGSTYVLTSTGKLYSCGYNSWGQLGLGTTTQTSNFTLVSGIPQTIIDVVASGEYANNNGAQVGILMSDGSVYTCGYNGQYNLGLGDATNRSTFSPVPLEEAIKTLYQHNLGSYSGFAFLSNTNQLYISGQAPSYGQQSTCAVTPVQIQF